MARLPFFRRTFRITRFQSDVPRDVADEIELYLEMRAQELMDEGMGPEDARRAALAAFGDRNRIEGECRRISGSEERRRRRAEVLGSVLTDVRHALRDMRKRPAFALVACLTLAICVAMNAAVFSLVHAIVLKPLPFPGSDRIAVVFNSYPDTGFPRAEVSVPDFFDRREGVEAFEEVALYQSRTRTVGEPGALQRVFAMIVTPSFFPVLQADAHLGRTLSEAESVPGNDLVAVIGYGLWQELFAGDPAVLGRKLRVEGRPRTVVGVMPEGFRFPGWDAELWLPEAITEEMRSDAARYSSNYGMIARLRPGATLDQAQSQLDALDAAILATLPSKLRTVVDASGYRSEVRSFHADLVRDVRPWLYLVWGGALLVFLIGAVSVANLLLVRSTGRLRELATRYVLGAGRGRLVRQLVTESAVLATAGGAAGLWAGRESLKLVQVFEAWEIPRLADVRLDAVAVLVTLVLASVVMGTASVLAAAAVRRRDLFAVLRAGASTSGAGHFSLRGSMVAAQVAVAFMLLIGSGLMLASLRNLLAVDLGFETQGVLAGALSPGSRYRDPTSQHRYLENVLAEIRSLPGVTDAAVASQIPFSGIENAGALTPQGAEREPEESLAVHYRTAVSSAYFSIIGLPILDGRAFSDADDGSSHPVVIVSESVAERYWPGVPAVGKKVFHGSEPRAGVEWATVVGVVGDVVQNQLTEGTALGAFYVPYRQRAIGFTRLVIKTETEPRALLGAVRERILAVDPELPLFWTRTLDESVDSALIPHRLPLQLISIFAAVALFLAAIGVYGVLAQSVTQRTKEISIRMALGGSRRRIYRWVLRSMLVFVAAGLALGLAGALSLTHLMRSLLYGVRPNDPAVFGLVGLVIGLVVVLAALVPARRATLIDPVKALSSE